MWYVLAKKLSSFSTLYEVGDPNLFRSALYVRLNDSGEL
jgi:hypothetical protein